MKEYFRAVGRELRALWRLTMRTLANTITASPSERWQRAECFHHNHKETVRGDSWIKSELIDFGRNKMWYCTECHQVWFLV